MPRATHTTSTGWLLFLFAAAAVLAIAAYLPALNGTFLFDDIPLLENQMCWRGIDEIPAMFGLGESNACSYRPIRYITFALDFSVGGMSPVALHVSNLVYHMLTGVLVFFVFRRWASAGTAILVMTLWLLHPVQADSVAYISGRRDIVSTLLYLAAFLQLLPRRDQRLKLSRVIFGLVLFVLAMQTKEMAVTLPAVLVWALWIQRWHDRQWLRAHFRRFGAMYVALALMVVAFVVYRGFVDSKSGMQGQWWGGSPVSNFATSFALLGRYLWILVWPEALVGDYFLETIPIAQSFADPRSVLGIGLGVGLILMIWWAYKRGQRATAFGIGWFLITLLPVAHVLPHHELFAEHYLYLPSIGLAAAVLPLVERGLATPSRYRWTTIALVALAVSGLSLRTAARSADFQSERAFYEEAFRHAPRNGRVLHYLAAIHTESGDCESALPLFAAASEILDPTTRIGRDSLVGFLLCSDTQGTREGVDNAIAWLLEAHPRDSYGLSWHGRRLFESNRLEEASAVLEVVVEQTASNDPDAIALLTMVYNRSGRHGDAANLAERNRQPHRILCEQEVLALMALGPERFDEAFDRVQICLQHFPESLYLLEFRASLYLAGGRRAEAEADIARMIELGAPSEVIERLRLLGGP